MTSPVKVSLIATVLNEGQTIGAWLDSMLKQSRQPDEIVIVDGGSTDNTLQQIRAYAHRLPINLIVQPDANISQGRNRAIHEAVHPIIASTDAGIRLHPDWLKHLIEPFEEDPQTRNVAGFFEADFVVTSPFEVAMSAAVLPTLTDISPERFLPSSRSVAFRKSSWETVQGYPEWLDYCEDLIFDIRLKEMTGNFTFVPQAIAYFRPRQNLKSYFLQYYRYARGDGKANLWRKRHLIRYGTYLIGIPVIFILGLIHSLFWSLFLIGGTVYFFAMWRRLPRYWQELSFRGKVIAVAWVAIIRVVGDIAKMIGYPVGWRWRKAHNPPHWQP